MRAQIAQRIYERAEHSQCIIYDYRSGLEFVALDTALGTFYIWINDNGIAQYNYRKGL